MLYIVNFTTELCCELLQSKFIILANTPQPAGSASLELK